MTLLFCDSFDHYATAQLSRKWTLAEGYWEIDNDAGRRGGGALVGSYFNYHVAKGIPGTDVVYVGFAYKTSKLTDSGHFVKFYEGATGHVTVRVTSTGAIKVESNYATVGQTAGGVIAVNTWNYIEIGVRIDNTAGWVRVRVDGADVLLATGSPSALDTREGGTGLIDSINLGAHSALDGYTYFDDLYICDDAGSRNNNFLGDVRIDCLAPSGNGDASELTGSDGNSTDNYLLVDDATPDDDTSYVESSTVDQHDFYAFPSLSHSPLRIFGVQAVACSKKDDAGSKSVALAARVGGVEYLGSDQALSTSYAMYRRIMETDPNAASPNDWTASAIASAEFGIEVGG